MKKIISLALVLICFSTLSRGIIIECWEKGVTQTNENIIYLNDGGYIYGGMVLYDGRTIDFQHPDSDIDQYKTRSECTKNFSINNCKETISFYNGDEITIELKYINTFNNGTDAFQGYLYEVEITEVFCKRSAI